MTRPNLPVALPAVLDREHVEFFPMVKLEFDTGTIYISGCDFNVDYQGEIWSSLNGLGSIDAIAESADEVPGLSLTISGVPNEAIVHAQTEKYRGRKVTVLWAFFDGDVLLVDPATWHGFIDVPIITRGADTCTIQITAENRMIDWQRPRGLLFNHADQQRFSTGDNFFLGIEGMVEREVVLFRGEDTAGGGGGYPDDSNLGSIIGVISGVVAAAQPPPTTGVAPLPPADTDNWVDID